MPIRRSLTEPVDRSDFSSEVINADRAPAPQDVRPGEKYLDVFASKIPVRESVSSVEIDVKVHKSHQPLISRGFFGLVLASTPNPIKQLQSNDVAVSYTHLRAHETGRNLV